MMKFHEISREISLRKTMKFHRKFQFSFPLSVACFILVEKKGQTLGESVHFAISALEESSEKLKALFAGDRKNIEKTFEGRQGMFLTKTSALADIFHTTHRGIKLKEDLTREALDTLTSSNSETNAPRMRTLQVAHRFNIGTHT